MHRFKTLILAVVITLALVAPAAAQQTLGESSQGRLWWTQINEAIMDSKIADAAKFRVGAPFELDESGGGGAFSFDVIGGDIPGMARGKRIEVVLMVGSMNRQGGGETSLIVTKRGTWGNIDDAAQVKVYEATSDAIEFRVPVIFSAGSNVGGASSPYPGCMGSGVEGDPQRWQFCQQGTDGNVVSYELVPDNAIRQWCARWSAYHGVIPRHTSPIAVCRQ
jgi:hypothetical protein